ncbi:MAG: SUMF1/EgtB/PvdO family nonheme iron enzyme [Chloroflexi bacterium]|nr:SUMF1/EgtB/PvdO family nonheme iron enzyme [Chloroflexota bacterium]
MNDAFISYSRRDTDFVRQLFEKLQADGRTVWVDWQGIDYSTKWWEEICEGIETSENFILVITPEALKSEYCNREIEHARKHNKRIIPVIYLPIETEDGKLHPDIIAGWFNQSWEDLARDNWEYLKTVQYLEFLQDTIDKAFAELIETIDKDPQYIKMHTRLLLWIREWEKSGRNPSYLLRSDDLLSAEKWLAEAGDEDPQPTDMHRTYIAESRKAENELKRLADEQERRTRRLRRASMTLVLVIFLLLLVAAFAGITTINSQNARATVEAESTFFAIQKDRVATLASGGVIIPLAQNTITPEAFIATLTQVAKLNTWQPVIQEFDGVEMVHVPAGCFYMGGSFDYNEITANPELLNEVCFDKPFWIDRYEVTNEQFERFNGVAENEPEFESASQPRTNVTWFEARDFCNMRDGNINDEWLDSVRLPTEAEWEYAARGPDSLTFPWGNRYKDHAAVSFVYDAGVGMSSVGTRPEGKSWVDAYDMAGNAAEWVNTIYDDRGTPRIESRYPYRIDDGREDLERSGTWVERVVRGGSVESLDYAFFRAADKSHLTQSFNSRTIGFRCARSN